VIEPYTTYAEWIASANQSSDPDIWRRHELFAREHMASDDHTWIDLGGEG